MAIQNLDYWYDGQMRRFISQMVRAFSGFQWQPGDRNGVPATPRVVPCRVASTNRMVGSILRNQSENTLLTVPMITVFQTGLAGRREMVQYPGFVDSLQVTERQVVDGKYTGEQGNRYTVDRIMPRPFEMMIQVDVWTSNLDQKHQLAEQILPVIYPTFDIQNSENPIDWTAVTTCLVENITFSSRSIPIGNSDEIDIMSIELKLPIWLSPPVKVKQQKIIQQIITNVFDGDSVDDMFTPTNRMSTTITTPGDYQVLVDGESVTLKGARGADQDAEAAPLDWSQTLAIYGKLRPAISAIRLYTTDDPEGPFVTGSIQLDPDASDRLIWQIDPDSLPGNTLPPVDAIIDPLRSPPGGTLPAPVEGVRYLLIHDIGPCQAWPNLTAKANDIIQFAGGVWTRSFVASANGTTPQYVLNLHTGRQLRWDGAEWLMAIDGLYGPGFWRLAL